MIIFSGFFCMNEPVASFLIYKVRKRLEKVIAHNLSEEDITLKLRD